MVIKTVPQIETERKKESGQRRTEREGERERNMSILAWSTRKLGRDIFASKDRITKQYPKGPTT